jgi:predicted CxxxxCH...CXXCH cytochrome family protein
MTRAALGACIVLLTACSEDRYEPPVPPVFDTDVAPLLEQACASCHGQAAPAAGWGVTSYLDAIACVQPSGAPATLPASTAAPLLSALAENPHQGLLDARAQETLTTWVTAGAPAFRSAVHAASIIDPRSSEFHGALLRSQRWKPMLDASDPAACGRCHDGTPAPPPGVTSFAPGAPSCTSCHDKLGGVLACPTCHGSGTKAYPPRDLCFFPGDASAGTAHAAHVNPSVARSAGFACATCHPVPGSPIIGGYHGDGTVEEIFDTAAIGPEVSVDRSSEVCAVTCHDAGGRRPRPAWTEAKPVGCNDCHLSPPASHFPGPCTSCHAEANATGTSLSGGPLHLDGRIELGNGSGQCGACHGTGASPWPSSEAHVAHENSSISLPVPCASCHPVPSAIEDSTHLDGVVHVQFSGLAAARGANPAWNGTQCSSVACHGAQLVDPPAVVPAWADPSGAADRCGACHGIPPSQHTTSKSCGDANCHAGEVALDAAGVPSITPSGLALHINGVIDVQ